MIDRRSSSTACRRAERGFSLLELMVAMFMTVVLMAVVFTLMRQNQGIFAAETGVTAMNENIRAAVDLLTREVQAAGTGMRGFSAPILGVDGEGERGDRIAIMIGDPDAPIAQVRAAGVSQVTLLAPPGVTAASLTYRDDRGKARPLYESGDRYVLYNDARFLVVRIGAATVAANGDVVVTFAPDRSNPRPRFGDYRFLHDAHATGALFARLDGIVYYRFDHETQTLERRENHEPWAAVARGILGFDVGYRSLTPEGALGEPVAAPPADREAIRSVVFTLRARTPDSEPGTPSYRETSERFEATPRNMRLPDVTGPDASDPT
jgi:prepilin-type N-terminal cleavage/methylation domain-containing protein